MFVYLCTNHRKSVKEEHSDICDSNVIADPDFEQNTSLESIHLSEIKFFNERSRLGVVSPVKWIYTPIQKLSSTLWYQKHKYKAFKVN